MANWSSMFCPVAPMETSLCGRPLPVRLRWSQVRRDRPMATAIVPRPISTSVSTTRAVLSEPVGGIGGGVVDAVVGDGGSAVSAVVGDGAAVVTWFGDTVPGVVGPG